MGISYVVDKAKIKCSKGIGKSTLRKSSENDNLELRGKVMLTIADNKPNKNVIPFELCKSESNPEVVANSMKPAKCNPVINVEWSNGEKDYYLNGKLALNSSCKLSCIYGGVITIIDDGQNG